MAAVKTTAEPVSSLANYIESNVTKTTDNFARLSDTVLLFARWVPEIIRQVAAMWPKKGKK